jgi:hypothetical protein
MATLDLSEASHITLDQILSRMSDLQREYGQLHRALEQGRFAVASPPMSQQVALEDVRAVIRQGTRPALPCAPSQVPAGPTPGGFTREQILHRPTISPPCVRGVRARIAGHVPAVGAIVAELLAGWVAFVAAMSPLFGPNATSIPVFPTHPPREMMRD